VDLWDSPERDHRAIQLQYWLSFKKKVKLISRSVQKSSGLSLPPQAQRLRLFAPWFRGGPPLFGSTVLDDHCRELWGQSHRAMGMMLPLQQAWRAEH